MSSQSLLAVALGVLAVAVVGGRGQVRALREGPGVQAAQDARYPQVIAQCRNPPPTARAGGPGGSPAGPAAPGRAGAAAPSNAAPGPSVVTAIPDVIAANQQWKVVWQDEGNNADGMVGTSDGAVLIARNDKSDVVKIDRNGKASVVYTDTNTGGALAFSSNGALFVAERALNPAIWQLAPQRKLLANRYQGDTLDCIGGALNDLAADAKGGVYFTMGGLYYADANGVITKYGENLRTNGIVLSADEKTLYVTNAGALAVFDVQPDGSLTNQREFALPGGGGDGSTIDAAGRIYVTGGPPGIRVIGPDGKYLGGIATPPGVHSVAFSGPNSRTLYAVALTRNEDVPAFAPGFIKGVQVLSIPMIARGHSGRAK